MKNNNENKKIDVSKVSGGVLSIEEKDGKFNVISSRVLDSFSTREDAQEAINIVAEQYWHNPYKVGPISFSSKKEYLKYLKSKRDH